MNFDFLSTYYPYFLYGTLVTLIAWDHRDFLKFWCLRGGNRPGRN